MTAAANLFPRFAPITAAGGKISTAWRRWFGAMLKRTGPQILPVSEASSNADFARAVNALLAECRAQKWIAPAIGGEDTSTNIAAAIRAVCMIPAATEFGYHTQEVRVNDGAGMDYAENRHTNEAETDFLASLDNLQAQAPNIEAISLFVTWFGSDLRCGECQITPKVDDDEKPTTPISWRVGGLNRNQASVVSYHDGHAAYGGTPADATIIAAIREMHNRVIDVSFTPFLLMDVPALNTLPNPYNPAEMQAVYPWRGRITCFPAPGVAGTPDGTDDAAAQIAAFVGTAQVSDFFAVDGEIFYGGPDEWSYRRMILHYAHLCALAGGVANFIIGTELRGLVWVRSSRVQHPFVDALRQLAADVSAILPDAKVLYAADWSEYAGYQPPDGSGDLLWPLDALWSSPDIDAVGIDNYFPLSDWRDGETHLDYVAGNTSIFDYSYLMGNCQNGEGYAWYYASSADRDAQIRTPITDGDYGESWVWRQKDIWSWWGNRHHRRLAGIREAEPTSWEAESKPIWFTELGCPAVDKGSNQPNVFVDPNSSESAYPYYSARTADGLIQRRYNLAWLRYVDPTDTTFVETRNPVSTVYGGRMVDLSRVYLYTWDARPYPEFPDLLFVWGDANNWQFGHWLTGRLPDIADTAMQDVYTMALKAALAPSNPYIIDPATQKLDKQWRDYFDAIGYVQGAAISNVASDATTTEIAEAINALIGALQKQGRIA